METTRRWPVVVTVATSVGSPASAVGDELSAGRSSDADTLRTDHRW